MCSLFVAVHQSTIYQVFSKICLNAILDRNNFNTTFEILMQHVILLYWISLCLALVDSKQIIRSNTEGGDSMGSRSQQRDGYVI